MGSDGGRRCRVADLGEFPLIERLAARLRPARPDVVAGIGDDVAALAVRPDRLLLVTCDVQVAGIHFVPERCDPHRLGRKAAAINLSDIASAGGRPSHFVCSLILPGETEVAFLERLYDGLGEEAARWGADVVGGNVSRGATLTIDLTLLGEVAPRDLLLRGGARVGDLVAVTGTLGAAAAGLQLSLRPDLVAAEPARSRALAAFETPTPRLDEAAALVAGGGVGGAIDVSDGLAADLTHVCEASGVGARLDAERIPVDPSAVLVAGAAGADPSRWALAGGEDYELLFTAPAARMDALRRAVTGATGTPVGVIGEIVPAAEGLTLARADGTRGPLDAAGWRHF